MGPRDKRYDVVVAGGGFVGRTLALALAKLAPHGFQIAPVSYTHLTLPTTPYV